ncbi:MAG: hypothetical protein AAF950_10500 [Pseudomonadota bacterium]
MFRTVTFSLAMTALATGCATTVSDSDTATTDAASISTSDITEFDRALSTADALVEAGNTPTAIDRLTQLLGDPSLTDAQRAVLYFERGKLRMSESGFDVWGAIADFEKVVDDYPESVVVTETQDLLGLARGEATSLNFLLDQPESTRSQRFSALLRLGEHDDAIDLMLSSNLRPENRELVAMYQIGYLCDGEDQTGPSYSATEPDGTRRELRFCDFGK